MQPTNAGGARLRSHPGLRPATTDRRFSRGRLQLISHSLGIHNHCLMRLLLVVGALVLASGRSTGAAIRRIGITEPDSCFGVRPDTAGWRRVVSEGGGFGFAIPPTFRPDSSLEAGFATYHGGEQLTDGRRTMYFSYYRPDDLRLQGGRQRPTRQTRGWPQPPNGWTLHIEQESEAGEAPGEEARFLSAWLTSPDGTEHYAITGSANVEQDLALVRAILCTIGVAH
jgi:hypothetical protein